MALQGNHSGRPAPKGYSAIRASLAPSIEIDNVLCSSRLGRNSLYDSSSIAVAMASGPAGEAWASLAPEQQDFIRRLPKAELHAHLNGCIPLEVLRELAKDRSLGGEAGDEMIERGLLVLANDNGVPLEKITDFFGLFPAIYALTSKPQALKRVTDAVLDLFLSPDEDGFPQCSYLELRTTPRKYQHMGRIQYLETVLESMARYQDRCALIVSVDWRMSEADVIDTLDAAIFLRNQGRGIVGIDLCGDFTAGE
jgi:adenosine deaminase